MANQVYRTGNFQATEQTANNMLLKKNIVSWNKDETGKNMPQARPCMVRVTRSLPGKELYWETPDVDPETGEESFRQYFIANTDLLTEYNAQKAIELFQAGDFQGAINQGMSFRVSPEEADKIEVAAGICTARITSYINKDGIEALGINKIFPNAPKAATPFSFDFFKKKAEADAAAAAAEFDAQSPVILKKNTDAQGVAAAAKAKTEAETTAALAAAEATL